MTELKSEFIFKYEGEVAFPEVFTPSYLGVRMFYVLKGGTVKGPQLNGTLLPGGGDWPVMRSDGVGEIDARFVIKTDDNELIYAYYRGIIVMSPEVGMRVQSGERLDPSEYYMRTTPIFETGSEKYAWLNKIICVGVGTFELGRVSYKVYKIL